jgi:hypothetical protein
MSPWTALAVFVIGAVLETWLISMLQPSEGELTWISDLVLAASLGVALVAGDRIVVVTDGIAERMTDVEAAVGRLNGHPPADAMCSSIFELSQSPGAAIPVPEWDDDRTVLVMAVD